MPRRYDTMVIGDEAIIGKLRHAEDSIRRRIYAAAMQAGLWVESTARMYVPKKTANLMRNIFSQVDRFTDRWEVKVSVHKGAPYGVYVEKGTGIYGERHHPYLVQKRSASGGVVSYLHPGMRAQPFIEPAFDYHKKQIRDLFGEIGHAIVREF